MSIPTYKHEPEVKRVLVEAIQQHYIDGNVGLARDVLKLSAPGMEDEADLIARIDCAAPAESTGLYIVLQRLYDLVSPDSKAAGEKVENYEKRLKVVLRQAKAIIKRVNDAAVLVERKY